jgi:hypothetical protein
MNNYHPAADAAGFWKRVGARELFPRNLRKSVLQALPVAIVQLPRLTLGEASRWLRARGVDRQLGSQDRMVRGCLLADRGHGFVFLDGSLEPEDERITLAHEVAHYWLHYEKPRATAIAGLGERIREALDGDRPFSPAEQFSAVVRNVPVGTYQHTLDRGHNGLPNAATLRMEREADVLAFELLAPSGKVRADSAPGQDCVDLLCTCFGFPAAEAALWADWIDAGRHEDSFITRLQRGARKLSG